jgi:hypothetical protein
LQKWCHRSADNGTKKSGAEKLAERVGMRVAFDGSIVPKDFLFL